MDTNIAEYTYDALGRRIERIDAVAGVTTCFYYDDQRVILESETRPEGLEQRVFVYGNYIDETLVMRRLIPGGSWVDFFYGHDHLYSPVALFSPVGTVLERYEYDAYGTVHVMDVAYNDRNTSLVRSPIAFTGRTLDSLDGGSLQIMYYRARYYDPETGRFMQRDPLGIDPSWGNIEPASPLSFGNAKMLYCYVGSNPTFYVDPLGLAKVEIGAYTGLGKSVGVSVDLFNEKDCCDNGVLIPDGIKEYNVGVNAHAGFGLAIIVKVGGLDVDLGWKGPGLIIQGDIMLKRNDCKDLWEGGGCLEGGVDGGDVTKS